MHRVGTSLKEVNVEPLQLSRHLSLTHSNYTMAAPRLFLHQARRSFATTSRRLQLPLAHQTWPSSNTASSEESSARPIIFMHGLFGSKQNNRGMSKYELSTR